MIVKWEASKTSVRGMRVVSSVVDGGEFGSRWGFLREVGCGPTSPSPCELCASTLVIREASGYLTKISDLHGAEQGA